MRITYLKICNYKSIRELVIQDVENALILVGKNNTGKTAVIDAILTAAGLRTPADWEYLDPGKPISISLQFELTDDDLQYYHTKGILSKAKDYEKWLEEFRQKLPSYHDHLLSFTILAKPDHKIRYQDGYAKHNPYILRIFTKIYHIDQTINLEALHNDVFSFYDK